MNSIDFSHSSRKARRTINKLTGKSGRSRQCPVSANSIASQLVKNVVHRTGWRESSRLINKKTSDLWKIPTPEGHSLGQRSLLFPSGAWRQVSLPDRIPSS